MVSNAINIPKTGFGRLDPFEKLNNETGTEVSSRFRCGDLREMMNRSHFVGS